jgi:hypothetical protein
MASARKAKMMRGKGQTYDQWRRAIYQDVSMFEVRIDSYANGRGVVHAHAVHLPTGRDLGEWKLDDGERQEGDGQ